MKKRLLKSMFCVVMLVLVGCGGQEKKESSQLAIKESTQVSTTESSINVESVSPSDTSDWSKIDKTLKKVTSAKKMEILYENNDSIESENEGVKSIINGYQYITIEDFSENFSLEYDNQVEKAAVLLLSMSFENNTDKAVYPKYDIFLKIREVKIESTNKSNLIEGDLTTTLAKQKRELKAGEKISGYYAVAVEPEKMNKIEEQKEGVIEIPGIYSDQENFGKEDIILAPKAVDIAFSKEGEDIVANNAKFYPDRVMTEKMGTKTMVSEKEIGETKEFSDIKITLDGYQVTEFEPNEEGAKNFENFDSEIILVTTKMTIKNDSTETFNVTQTSGELVASDFKQVSEGFLGTRGIKDGLDPGKEEIKYNVFVFDKETYEKTYKDKEIILDVSLYDMKWARITKRGDIIFTFKN